MKGKSLLPRLRGPFFRSLIGVVLAKGSELLIVLPFLTLPVYIAQSASTGMLCTVLLLKKEECVSCRDIEEKREQV